MEALQEHPCLAERFGLSYSKLPGSDTLPCSGTGVFRLKSHGDNSVRFVSEIVI